MTKHLFSCLLVLIVSTTIASADWQLYNGTDLSERIGDCQNNGDCYYTPLATEAFDVVDENCTEWGSSGTCVASTTFPDITTSTPLWIECGNFPVEDCWCALLGSTMDPLAIFYDAGCDGSGQWLMGGGLICPPGKQCRQH